MGVPGLWDVLRPTGEVRSLTHLAVESGFIANDHGHRAYRIGIDVSIWLHHAQGGREGENPELRTLFFRCCRLLAMPFLPIFVFDGPQRPNIKRGRAIGGKEHWLVNSLRTVLDAFGFEFRTAPGEAEAELAFLNRAGVIDAVLSDDVDCFLFGARTVIRNSSATLSGNKAHSVKNADGKEDGQHAHVYHTDDVLGNPEVRLSQGGLILIALLRGGDYDQHGIDGCGVTIAHALALAGFGDTLLAAARSPNPDALPILLPSWRTALRHELRTNASGLAPRKSPRLAQRITDDFPRLDVLRCYTHPLTSEAHMRGLDALWLKTPCIAKIARVCEMYFEWAVEPTVVRRFRRFLWPGAVLRGLLRAALDKDQERRDGRGRTSSTEHRTVDGEVETPSKTLARTLGGMALAINHESDSEDEGGNIIRAIHSERRHASTDHVLEYRLEIRPSELVRQARVGITGSRVEMGGSAPGGVENENDDDDDGGEDGESPKKGRAKKPPPHPESVLRLWMPAVMVAYVYPGLVAEWEEKKRGKEARKAKRGKAMETKNGTKIWDSDGTNLGTPEKFKAPPEAQRALDGDDQRPGVKKAPAKTKTGKIKPLKAHRAEADAEDSDEASTVFKKALVRAKVKQPDTKKYSTSTLTASDSDSGSKSQSALQLLDDTNPFLVSSALAEPKVSAQARPAVEDVEGTDSPSISRAGRPFPMPIPTRTRKHSTTSMTSSSSSLDGSRARLKKSPRKCQEHVFSRKRSPAPRMASSARSPSPSPSRPLFGAHTKPLHMTARPAGSRTADDVIVISSDSDTPARRLKVEVHKTKVALGATYCQVGIKKVLSSSNTVPDSDIIDLT